MSPIGVVLVDVDILWEGMVVGLDLDLDSGSASASVVGLMERSERSERIILC